MTWAISGYTDPGVYVREVVVPGTSSNQTVPLVACLIANGSRNKRVYDEALLRAFVDSEAMTLSVGSPHRWVMARASNRKSAQTVVEKDGVALTAGTDWTWNSVKALSLAQNYDLSTLNIVSLALDGKNQIAIKIVKTAGATPATTTVSGNLITHDARTGVGSTISNIAAVTAAELTVVLNTCFAAAGSLGYGSAYGSVASVSGTSVLLTSPINTSASAIAFYESFPATADATTALFDWAGAADAQAYKFNPALASTPFYVPSCVTVSDAQYSGTSTYTVSYITTDESVVDTLANTNVQSMVRVGNYAGVTNYVLNTDYTRSSSDLQWYSGAVAASITGSMTETFDLSTNDKVIVAVDGKAAVTIDLNGLVSAPPGYANPAVPAAATAEEIVANINSVLSYTVGYGAQYCKVATAITAGTIVKLTSPNKGTGSSVTLSEPATLSAVTAIFGVASASLPYQTIGTGTRPTPGSTYYATYEYTRLSSEYNLPKRFYTPDDVVADIGQPTVTPIMNRLTIGAQIAFENRAPSVIVVQIDDSNTPGSPIASEIQAAINGAATTTVGTDVVVLDTKTTTHTALINFLETENGPVAKHYCRGYFGMPRGTLVGDTDTSGTFVYTATRTLQVSADSPARGRMMLVAPADVSRNVTIESGAVVATDLDSTYTAAAIAALQTSFTLASNALIRRTITGFIVDDFETYVAGERWMLAQNGVTVVTSDAGLLKLLDPVTTEAGGGGLITFSEPSASVQKDVVTRAVQDTVDNNLVGVVPDSPDTFITTIKNYISTAIESKITSGDIGPYTDTSGKRRDIDLTTDIQVFQVRSDPTQYYFRYWFNLRFPAKRFFGEYSVQNPFYTT